VHAPEREIRKKYPCPMCPKSFSRARDTKRHIENIHEKHQEPTSDPIYQTLVSKINELQSKLEEKIEETTEKQKERDEKLYHTINELQKKQPNNIVNNLNIVCVTDHDNYLDMLTDRMGNFDQAIDYIKDCALSDLVGDCKLIEKIYKNPDGELSFSSDQKNSQIYYQNEGKQHTSENKEMFGRKLANNLQNSYLKGINYLINRNLDQKGDPNKFLDSYDVMTWNNHIYQLSDTHHQHKMITNLNLTHANR
jgi:exonuclease VII large subunit